MSCEHCEQISGSNMPVSEKIMRVIACRHDVTVAMLRSTAKPQFLVRARREVWWEMSIVLRWSLPVAARVTGGRDHTTVLYGIRREAEDRYGLPFRTSLEEIRRVWFFDQNARPLFDSEDHSADKQQMEEAA